MTTEYTTDDWVFVRNYPWQRVEMVLSDSGRELLVPKLAHADQDFIDACGRILQELYRLRQELDNALAHLEAEHSDEGSYLAMKERIKQLENNDG